jgi:hypothetical protein
LTIFAAPPAEDCAMAEAQIIVTDLAKEFRVRKRGEGLAAPS